MRRRSVRWRLRAFRRIMIASAARRGRTLERMSWRGEGGGFEVSTVNGWRQAEVERLYEETTSELHGGFAAVVPGGHRDGVHGVGAVGDDVSGWGGARGGGG